MRTENQSKEPASASGVDSSALLAENEALRECLSDLVDMYRDFLDGDITHSEAYYCFYKGKGHLWGKAEELLANVEMRHRYSGQRC